MINTLAPGAVTLTAEVKECKFLTTSSNVPMGIFILSDDSEYIKCVAFAENMEMTKVLRIRGIYQFTNIWCKKGQDSKFELKITEKTMIKVIEKPPDMTLASYMDEENEKVLQDIYGVVVSCDTEFSHTSKGTVQHKLSISDGTTKTSVMLTRFGNALSQKIAEGDIILVPRCKKVQDNLFFVFDDVVVNPSEIPEYIEKFKKEYKKEEKIVYEEVKDLIEIPINSKVFFKSIVVSIPEGGIKKTQSGSEKRTIQMMGKDNVTIAVTLFNSATKYVMKEGDVFVMKVTTSDYDKHSLCVWENADIDKVEEEDECLALTNLWKNMKNESIKSVSQSFDDENIILLSDIGDRVGSRITVSGTLMVQDRDTVWIVNGDNKASVSGNTSKLIPGSKVMLRFVLAEKEGLVVDDDTIIAKI